MGPDRDRTRDPWICRLMGYEKEAYLYLLFHYTGKKRFSREHTKNPNANVQARPNVTFWAVGYHHHYFTVKQRFISGLFQRKL